MDEEKERQRTFGVSTAEKSSERGRPPGAALGCGVTCPRSAAHWRRWLPRCLRSSCSRRFRCRSYPSPGCVSQAPRQPRSEEHTSELQSHSDLVCRLLLEK